MTYKNNSAGKSTREMAKRRQKTYLSIGLGGIALLGIIWFISGNTKELGISSDVMLVLLVLALVIKVVAENMIDKGSKAERRANRGAKAEENIGDILSQLSREFLVINDVRSPFGNIDHIVISKQNGIFLIETKAHGGTVTVYGESILVNNKPPEKNFISQALQNSFWLRSEIGQMLTTQPWITPVIVFTNAFVTHSRPVKGVIIVNKKFLPNLLQRAARPNPINVRVWEIRDRIMAKLS